VVMQFSVHCCTKISLDPLFLIVRKAQPIQIHVYLTLPYLCSMRKTCACCGNLSAAESKRATLSLDLNLPSFGRPTVSNLKALRFGPTVGKTSDVAAVITDVDSSSLAAVRRYSRKHQHRNGKRSTDRQKREVRDTRAQIHRYYLKIYPKMCHKIILRQKL